jgi:hypothetical protein
MPKTKFLKHAAIVLEMVAILLPLSWTFTFMTFPFWRFLDTQTGIESFGHSGPAEWCFWLDYALMVALFLVLYVRSARKPLPQP